MPHKPTSSVPALLKILEKRYPPNIISRPLLEKIAIQANMRHPLSAYQAMARAEEMADGVNCLYLNTDNNYVLEAPVHIIMKAIGEGFSICLYFSRREPVTFSIDEDDLKLIADTQGGIDTYMRMIDLDDGSDFIRFEVAEPRPFKLSTRHSAFAPDDVFVFSIPE